MTIRSGRLAVLNGIHTVQQWSINEVTDPKAFKASNTGGGTGRRKGNRDWNGSYTQLTALPTHMPGEKFAFTGYSNDVDGDGSVSYAGNAIVDQVVITWNWATAEIITSAVTFSGDGKLTPGTATGTDLTMPDAPSTLCTKLEWEVATGDGSGFAEWEELTQMSLTITAQNVASVTSSSCENVGGKMYAWNVRKRGSIDWTLSLTEEDSDGLPAARTLQEDIKLRAWVDDAEYWELADGHIGSATGINFNPDTSAIIGRTIPISMNAARVGATQLGRVLKPGGALWWGTAAA